MGVLRPSAVGCCAKHLTGRQVVGNTHERRYEMMPVDILIGCYVMIEIICQFFRNAVHIIIIIAVFGYRLRLCTQWAS